MTKIRFFRTKKEPADLVQYVRQVANQSNKSRAYKRSFWNLANLIVRYQEYRGVSLTTASMNLRTYDDFVFFLRNSYPYRSGTIIRITGIIKKVLNEAERDGYSVDWGLKDVKMKKEPVTTVYLSVEEIDRIYYLKVKGESDMIRDRFLIGCWTGLRYSDFSVLSLNNLSDNTIRIRTQKTGESVILPLHWMVQEIMEKYGGSFPPVSTSRQNFNKVIKTLCKRAGINNRILVERTEGNKVVKRSYKKYQLVSSHTGRRSFATNLYLAGIPAAKIMLCTGHRTEEAFFRYIRIDKEENAKELAESPIFKKDLKFEEIKP